MKVMNMSVELKMSPAIEKMHAHLLYAYDDYYELELNDRIYELLVSNIGDIVRQLDRDFRQGILDPDQYPIEG